VPVKVVVPLSLTAPRRAVAPNEPSETAPVPDRIVSDWPPAIEPSIAAVMMLPLAALVFRVVAPARVTAPFRAMDDADKLPDRVDAPFRVKLPPSETVPKLKFVPPFPTALPA